MTTWCDFVTFMVIYFTKSRYKQEPLYICSRNYTTMIKKGIFLLAGYLMVSACNTPPPESRYDKIAAGFCECTAQLAALNKEAVAIADDTTGKAAPIFRQMEAEYNKARECSATIVAQFGKLKKAEFPLLEKSLSGRCPDLATQRDLMMEMLGE